MFAGQPATLLMAALCCSLLTHQPLFAHPDLLLQIEDVSSRITADARNPDLYLKRGDLYRRHGDWLNGEKDFVTARQLDPGHVLLDWFEGRFRVDAGQLKEGDTLLSRFLEHNPRHAAAYRVRAGARSSLDQPVSAAEDYQKAIEYSARPSPSLYRALVLSQVASGSEYSAAATGSVDRGLERFPQELSLLGLGMELALANAQATRARDYLARLPAPLTALPQWRFRQALLACIDGGSEQATGIFLAMTPGSHSYVPPRAGTWTAPTDMISELAAHPHPGTCSDAAWDVLRRQTP